MSENVFVERRPDGNYAVRLPNAERASAVTPTQEEAIERARDMHPEANVLVERVRHLTGSKPGQWRKP